jgi:DNA-binding IclR family transcriptional regulator
MNAFDVVLVGAIHEFQSKQTEPSIRKLVERTGKADDTVRAHLRKLEEYGWLRRVAQYDQEDGARAPNQYDFSALAEELGRRLGQQTTASST